MKVGVEHFGIQAASSLMEGDDVGDEQPITGLGALQVSERLFLVAVGADDSCLAQWRPKWQK
jgi:hypothetical protein